MEFVRESSYRCGLIGDDLGVTILIQDDPVVLQRLRRSLDGIAVGDIYTDDKMVAYQQRQVIATVPIPKLPALDRMADIIRVDGGQCQPTGDSKVIPSKTDLEDAIAQVVPKAGTGTVKTQGLNSHNAASWQDATYKGAGVKLGIIDTGFEDDSEPTRGSIVIQTTATWLPKPESTDGPGWTA